MNQLDDRLREQTAVATRDATTPAVTSSEPPPRVSSQDRLLALIQKKYPEYHPVVALVDLAHTTEDEAIELNCHKEVARYVVAVDRFVEVKSEIKQTKRVTVELFGGQDRAKPVHTIENAPSANLADLGVTDVVPRAAVHSEAEAQERRGCVRMTGPVGGEDGDDRGDGRDRAQPSPPPARDSLQDAWGHVVQAGRMM